MTVLTIIGSSNAVNLTDGLDGLATGLVIMVGLALTVLAYLSGRADFSEYLQIPFVTDGGEIAIFCLAVVDGARAVGFDVGPEERRLERILDELEARRRGG